MEDMRMAVLYESCPFGQEENVVVIDDNYTGVQSLAHELAGAEIEDAVCDYIKALKNLVESGGLEGETATKLYEFAELAEQLLKGAASELGVRKKHCMEEFLAAIDEADEEIY